MLEQHKTQTQEATIKKLKQAEGERMQPFKSTRRCRRKISRRQSSLLSIGSLDGSDSDATVEAEDKQEQDEDDECDEDSGFDLVLGANDENDEEENVDEEDEDGDVLFA